MKAILEFDLPDDSHDFDIAINANKLYSSYYDFDSFFRDIVKHNIIPDDLTIPEDQQEFFFGIMEHVRDKFYECLSDNNVNLE